MKLCNIFEDESPSSDALHYYMTEGCGIFAYALWLACSKPESGRIGIISDRHGEKWSRTIPFEVTHAFFLIESNGVGIDVKGIRPIWQITRDFDDSYFHSQYHPDDFRRQFMGNSDRKPLYGGQSEVREAVEVIRRFQDFYYLPTT